MAAAVRLTGWMLKEEWECQPNMGTHSRRRRSSSGGHEATPSFKTPGRQRTQARRAVPVEHCGVIVDRDQPRCEGRRLRGRACAW